ncbi:MAG: glycosyltransferase family 39 protein, partial [Chloroflexota bacterium]
MARWPIIIILLVATLLRFYQIDAQSLWSDEGNSYALIQAGFVDIANRTAFDIHPPLYYWLLKLWSVILGESVFALRSFSAVLGKIYININYKNCKRFFCGSVAL